MTTQEVLRIARLMAWGFGSFVWAIPHGQAQITSIPQTMTQISTQYGIAAQNCFSAQNSPGRGVACDQMEALGDQLTALDQIALQANMAKMEAEMPKLVSATRELRVLAYKKWCHTNPWRWIRHYRKPLWCNQ